MATQNELALAFGLVIAAGASTIIGASSVFFVRPGVDLRAALACSLGLSAGVMIYISFVEIYAIKSIQGFKDAGYNNAEAARFATLCFFGGMGLLWVLDKVVHGILHMAEHGLFATFKKHQADPDIEVATVADATAAARAEVSRESGALTHQPANQSQQPAGQSHQPASQSHQPASTVLLLQAHLTHASSEHTSPPTSTQAAVTSGVQEQPHQGISTPAQSVSRGHDDDHVHASHRSHGSAAPGVHPELHDTHEAVAMILRSDQKDVGLSRTGMMAAMAIGLHNLPEGLATFVATLADPTAGVVIALAIALHNIPEGVVVAMPVWLASGSKWKGFLWGSISGLTEPLGALIGWAVLHGDDIPPLASGVMLGLVAGMMVWISITELLPTAFKYDPKHTYSITATISGMVIMALSLLLFEV